MFLTDRAIVKGARITRDGYLVADALVAKANNIQEYRAAELGLTDRAPDAVVRIFRPEAEVFAADAMASAAHRPVTIGHPPVMVDAKNWREYARGDMGGEVVRDGEYVRVPLKILDAAAVESVSTDHREFSMGYSCKLDMTAGVHDGEAYDGSVGTIRYNHLAACRTARGGSDLTITDERPPAQPKDDKTMTLKTITFDGLQVADVSPAAEAVIVKLQGQVVAATDAKVAKDGEVVKLTAEAVAKDAKIAELTAALDAAKITPAALRDAAKAFAATVAKAKAIGFAVTDAMDETAIMRGVVDSKMKDVKDEHLQVAFDALTAGLKIDDGVDHLADGFKSLDPKIVNLGDAASREKAAYEKSLGQFAPRKSA